VSDAVAAHEPADGESSGSSERLVERSWLLEHRLNPFPVGGELIWSAGTLSFTLAELAAEASLGWVAERLGTDADQLRARLRGGEQVAVFTLDRAEMLVHWPKSMGGAALEVTDQQGRRWLIAMDYPSGGSISQTLSLISGRRKAKVWREALGAI
jgi:hypothetical protein